MPRKCSSLVRSIVQPSKADSVEENISALPWEGLAALPPDSIWEPFR